MKFGAVTRKRTPQVLPFDRAGRDVARRARAFIDGHYREHIRMKDLCHETGLSIRTVQRCFRQHFGVTVTSYLKAVRLDAAHCDLVTANPSRDTVTKIALRNGCSHLGRFSSEFRERFGQLPHETLRIEPSASA
jgi:AraC-like DNA-binding protein